MTGNNPSLKRIVMLDNQDSFVYNLVDAIQGRPIVFRNTVPVSTILDAKPDLLVLSPGPGHPSEAGCMMDLIDAALGKIPILGICLGFQALLTHFGGDVHPIGAVHGETDEMLITRNHPMFHVKQGDTMGVARYHSLGCTEIPSGMHTLGTIGNIIMAAETDDHSALGFQFHPESILTPTGPTLLHSAFDYLLGERK